MPTLTDPTDVLAALPHGVVLLDADHVIVWANPAAAALLGLDLRLDLGQRLDNLVRNPSFAACLEGDGDGAVLLSTPDESQRPLSLRVLPYRRSHQVVLVEDISVQTAAETARRDFVANASHELRSPLTVIQGYVEAMAEDDGIDPLWREPLDEMQRQARRMSALLDDLLDLARLETLGTDAHGEPVDMPALIERLRIEALGLSGGDRVISLEVDTGHHLYGEESDIRSALSNLIANAVRYTAPGGAIGIRWWVNAEGGHVAVSDDGIGIPDDDIPRLTERFYRVDRGRTRERGGTGLGLAIVRHALMRHGAHLDIDSELGVGSTFTCHFPRQRVARAGDSLTATPVDT